MRETEISTNRPHTPCSSAELLQRIACGICQLFYDNMLTITYANDYFYSLFSCTNDKALLSNHPQSFFDLLSDKEFEKLSDTIHKNIQAGLSIFQSECILSGQDSKVVYLLLVFRYEPIDNTLVCSLQDITIMKQREEDHRITAETNLIAVKQEHIMTLRYHVPTQTLFVPQEIALKFNLPTVNPDWLNTVPPNLILPSSLDDFNNFYKAMINGEPSGSLTLQMRDCQKEVHWYVAYFTMIYDTLGAPLYSVISFKESDELWEKELAYEKWKQMNMTQLVNSIGYYESNLTKNIFEHVEGSLAETLPNFTSTSFDTTIKYVAENLLYFEDKENYLEVFSPELLLRKYAAGEKDIQFEHRRLNALGNPFWVRAELQMFADPFSNDIKCFTIIRNIHQEKETLMTLEERSKIDELTGLYNRVTTIDKINHLIKKNSHSCHALIMLDIDYFKKLNDRWGHAFGDTVLHEISGLLRSHLRGSDIAGRLGGDEFILFLHNISMDTSLQSRLQQLCSILTKEYSHGSTVTCSLGVSLYPRDGKSFEELYLKADTALYQSKGLGRNQYSFYSPE